MCSSTKTLKSLLFSLLFPSLFLFQSCAKDTNLNQPAYSFFVAGHVYGTPSVRMEGLYPPFKRKFSLIKEWPGMELGIFTGDVTRSGWADQMDFFIEEVKELEMPYFIAPGNHEYYELEEFGKRFGPTYYDFMRNGDLFIVLDPSADHWNISGAQLDFLKKSLEENKHVKNVFVFMHQLIWRERDNIFRNVIPNSRQWRADEINFWTEVEPLFHRLNGEVYFFGGDIGAIMRYSESYCRYEYDNIHFYGSGMGRGEKDNFLIVEVSENKETKVRLIAINGDDIDALGKIEDYRLPPMKLSQ